MSPTEIGLSLVAAALTGALAWAAISDVLTRKIPNPAVLIVLALFIPWLAMTGLAALVGALLAAAIAFVVSFALWNLKIVGAGDSKLFASVALFAGLGHLAQLAAGTALVGGLIALVIMVTRPRRALVMITMRGKGDFGDGIPYGVAIAAAGAAVVWVGLYAPHWLDLR